MTREEFVERVLVRLGENSAILGDGADFPGDTLLPRIAAAIEPAVAQAIMETPVFALTGWKPFARDAVKEISDGRGILPLPAGMIRFLSLKMRGWARPVTEILPRSHWLRRLQGSKWHGLRGTPDRPIAFHAVDGGVMAMELFGCVDGDEVEEGWYMEAPRFDIDGNIEIPPAALHRAVDLTVSQYAVKSVD